MKALDAAALEDFRYRIYEAKTKCREALIELRLHMGYSPDAKALEAIYECVDQYAAPNLAVLEEHANAT